MIRFWLKSFIVILFFVVNLEALSLRDSVEQTINTNPTVIAEQKNQDAYKTYVDEQKGDYLPTIDLESYYEESHTYNNPDNADKNDAHKNGWNSSLRLEQILYDGGLTPSEVEEYIHRNNSNKFRSNLAIENEILNTTNSYLSLVQYKEMMNLSEAMIEVHERNLITAKEKEEISGEKLETYQVSSKLYFTQERFLEQEDLSLQASANFKRFVGLKPEGKICRPLVNEKILPNSLEKAIELAVRQNYSILEQVEKIKIQREKLAQVDSSFLPTLSFQLQGQWDDDLELAENGRQDIYRARFFMRWNLFNGGKDKLASQRELLFMQEAKKSLDVITDEIVSTVTNSYNTYHKNKKRVELLKLYTNENRNILDVYRKEFNSGTRTFIDILNAESEFYSSNISLLERELELYKQYYSLLKELSVLSDTILSQDNQICKKAEKLVLIEEVNEKENDSEDFDLKELFNSDSVEKNVDSNKNKIEYEKDDDYLPDYIKNIYTDSTTLTPDKKNVKHEQKKENNLNIFLKSPSNYYTINMSTVKSLKSANLFLKKHGLLNNGYGFKFGKSSNSAKVLYGVYPNIEDAKLALNSLNKKLIKLYSPYIDYVSKHQNLYNKYN